jgi:hypothetical protein
VQRLNFLDSLRHRGKLASNDKSSAVVFLACLLATSIGGLPEQKPLGTPPDGALVLVPHHHFRKTSA